MGEQVIFVTPIDLFGELNLAYRPSLRSRISCPNSMFQIDTTSSWDH